MELGKKKKLESCHIIVALCSMYHAHGGRALGSFMRVVIFSLWLDRWGSLSTVV